MNKLTKDLYPTIIEMYRNGGTCHGIARELDLCRVSVTGVIKRHGITIRGWTRLQESQHEEIRDLYLGGKTVAEVAEQYNVSWNVVRRILTKMSTPVRDQERFTKRYSFNIHYFDSIDSPDKAYWLGVLWADGHNSEKRGSVCFSQCVKDVDLVEKFKRAIQADHNIIDKTSKLKGKSFPYKEIFLSDRYFSERLSSLGMFHDKTWRSSMPVMPHEFIFHFLRGFIDGDGSICLNLSKGPQISFSSHHSLVQELSDVFVEQLDVHCSINRKQNYSVSFICGNKQVSRLLWHLYKDSTPETRMDRKYQRYLEVMAYCHERARDKTRSDLEVHP